MSRSNFTEANEKALSEDILLTMNNASTTPVSEIAVRSASLIFIALLSMFGNCLVCITLYRRPYLLTPSNKLVFSLTTTNFVFSVIVLPFVITGSITEQWYFGKVWCAITGFLTLLVMGASMLILAAIACDRYYAIVHPLAYPSVITGFRATVVIIVCWVFAAACAAPPLFGAWSQYKFQPYRCGCFPVWQEELGFTFFWFILCFFTPYLLMIGCYACIFKVARTKTRQVHSRVESPSRFAGPSDDTGSNSSDSGSYTEVSDAFPTTRVIGVNSAVTTHQPPNGKIITKADVNDNAPSILDEDSGIICSETTTSSVTANGYYQKEIGRRSFGDCSRLCLPNQVEPKESPKFTSRRNSLVGVDGEGANSTHTEAEFQLKNSRKSSNASIVSSTSQVLRRTSLAFSAVRYYSNQMKAVFTIAFILGILLVTMGPFVIIALIEAVYGNKEVVEIAENDEEFVRKSPVSTVTLSFSTCFMYLTCVYYPLIYGLWNRTVRKEMRNLLCGLKHKDHRQFHRPRILSLTTHIQDLGMSPGLTAAIIGESDPSSFNANLLQERHLHRRLSQRNISEEKDEQMIVPNKRRHTLHSLSGGSLLPEVTGVGSSGAHGRPHHPQHHHHHRHSGFLARMRREAFRGRLGIGVIAEESDQEDGVVAKSSPENYSNNSNMRRWRHDYSITTVSDTIKETEAEMPSMSQAPVTSSYKMRLQTKDDILVPVSYDKKDCNKARVREKPATSGLLELSSAEVLSSAALSSALLFAGYDFKSRPALLSKSPQVNRTLSDPGERVDRPMNLSNVVIEHVAKQSNLSDEITGNEGIKKQLNNTDFARALGNIPMPESRPKPILQNAVMYQKSHAPEDDNTISMITQGRLHGSNLVHLEAGEPKTIKKWSESQFVDFFASSIAYGAVEEGKFELQEEERCPSRN